MPLCFSQIKLMMMNVYTYIYTSLPSNAGVARTYAEAWRSTVALWMAILDSGWTPSAGDELTVAGNVAAAANTTMTTATVVAMPQLLQTRSPAGH